MAYEKIKYNNQYNKANYDKITILVPKGEKDEWKAFAQKKGLSMTEMVRRAVADYFEKS